MTAIEIWEKYNKKEEANKNKKPYSKLLPYKCARCGKKWKPTCCDYSYKAIAYRLREDEIRFCDADYTRLTIRENNRLNKWQNMQ
jgi:hypothetical protein